jgi:hypothetical protein
LKIEIAKTHYATNTDNLLWLFGSAALGVYLSRETGGTKTRSSSDSDKYNHRTKKRKKKKKLPLPPDMWQLISEQQFQFQCLPSSC